MHTEGGGGGGPKSANFEHTYFMDGLSPKVQIITYSNQVALYTDHAIKIRLNACVVRVLIDEHAWMTFFGYGNL